MCVDNIHWIDAPLKQTFAPLSRVGRGPYSKSLICTTLQAGNSQNDDDDDDVPESHLYDITNWDRRNSNLIVSLVKNYISQPKAKCEFLPSPLSSWASGGSLKM